MPEQSNMDNYAYERDLILLNNLLMKRLLQQRMRMNGDANTNNNNHQNSNNNNNSNPTSKNKKTISDVYGPTSANVNNAVATREVKKNFSMVEARKAGGLSTTEQSILHPKPHRTQPILSSRHSPTSRNNSNNHIEHLATVSEEPGSEKSTPVITERTSRHHHHHHHHSHHNHHTNRTTTTSSSSAEESGCEKPNPAPGQSSQAPSTISSTPDSEQSFRKNTPTRTIASSRKSTVNKINIRQLPPCKQPTTANTKCCDETTKKPTTTNCNQCPSNVCPPPPRPFFPPPLTNLNNPFRSFNFPSLNTNFYYPYNNNYNYPLMRTNFNSFPQFNPYNFQSSFYLPNFFSQRPLEPLKPLKPLPMSHFQTNPLNGQPIIVL